jgi:hypothetical protein
VAGSAAAWPMAARAQQRGEQRIGVLTSRDGHHSVRPLFAPR